VRYLVVGHGNLGRRRARILGARCVATVDPVASDASVRSVDHVAASRYDAVVLATPNATKRDYVERFVGAGKSVLVEKPLPLADRATGERLRAAARSGAIWYTAYNHRFEPLVARLKERLDDGAVGKLDRARMLYGNGTVREWIGSWRESGAGVLDDLGCHLLDLAGWLLGRRDDRHVLWDLRRVESTTFDYGLFATSDRRVVFEIGNIFWKNTFRIDVYGTAGSLHLDGLGKWGGARLVQRARVLPSGPPVETVETTGAGDVTWEADLAEFERCVAAREDSLDNDWRIAAAIAGLLREAGSP
jgi:scyllo-inositol 2-dehydrogenase (NADP+)